MTLAEFVKSKREELGITWNDIYDAGIAHCTYSRVANGIQTAMKPATMEKFAQLFKCDKGEIQACMAETPNPLRAEAGCLEGKAGFSITAGAGKSKRDKVDKLMRERPFTPAPEPEEPEEVSQPEPDEREEDEEQAEYTFSEVKELEQIALNVYKQYLRDMCLRIFTTGIPGTHTMKDIYADIGYAIVKELAKGGETDETL